MAARQKISEDAGTAAALSVQDGIFTLKEKQKWKTRLYWWFAFFSSFFLSPNWLWQELKQWRIATSHEVVMCSLRWIWQQQEPSTSSRTFDSYV